MNPPLMSLEAFAATELNKISIR